MRVYEQRLGQYGLTHDQYRRAVAAHELAHALVANARPSTTCYGIELRDDRTRGVHGLTATSNSRNARTIDPLDRAVVLEAGAIAKERWLREVERMWSRQIEQLVHATAAGDRKNLNTLGLSSRQQDTARREAAALVGTLWTTLKAGVPTLVTKGRLNEHHLAALSRTGRTTRSLRGFFG